MTRHELMLAAKRKYRLRARHAHESEEAYLAALVELVRNHDFAAAHEIQVGKVQAEWSSDEVAGFLAFMQQQPHPRPSGLTHQQALATIAGLEPVAQLASLDAETLLDYAGLAMGSFMEMRIAKPTAELPILAHLILHDGTALLTTVDRGARVALVRAGAPALAAYVVCADTWIHRVNAESSVATKLDALVGHLGSRAGLRRMFVRPYRFEQGVIRFDAQEDQDLAQLRTDGASTVSDPYAGVFAADDAPGVH